MMKNFLAIGREFNAVSKSIFTAMNIKFYLRDYVNKDGNSLIYLSISSAGKRKRIPMDIYINPENWDPKKQRAKNKTENSETINLLLDQMSSRISDIRVHYRLSKLPLSIDKLIEELKHRTPNYDFLAFMRNYLEQCVMKKSSYEKNISEINKLSEFKAFIPFSDINLEFINKYKAFLSKEKKNAPTTIAFSTKNILKYIRVAKKYEIYINLDPDMVKVGSTKGNRVNLNLEEVQKLHAYYESQFITTGHKLALGYFLFSCYTSLRISDIKALKREGVLADTITFEIKKTGKLHTIPLNKKAKAVINHYPELRHLSYHTNHRNLILPQNLPTMRFLLRQNTHCTALLFYPIQKIFQITTQKQDRYNALYSANTKTTNHAISPIIYSYHKYIITINLPLHRYFKKLKQKNRLLSVC